MASAVDSRLAYARLSAVATASRLPTATRGSNNSYTTSWDTTRNRPLVAEEAILLRDWNQCLSLIWFDESLTPVRERWDEDEDKQPLLKELDGTLPWPSKSRRR